MACGPWFLPAAGKKDAIPRNEDNRNPPNNSAPTFNMNVANQNAGGPSDQNNGESASTSNAGNLPLDNMQIFSFRKLQKAADNFSKNSLIGGGGFGPVYKAILKSGQIVAVKMLNLQSLHGDKEFLSEIIVLSLLRHPNIVKLIGFSAERVERLLVYEFAPLGSLDKRLHDLKSGSKAILDWETRMTIALGTAEGLNYLHNVATPPLIFRDLKTANILLDQNFRPKLCDFGTAKLCPVGDRAFFSNTIVGTTGYLAPEYKETGNFSKKSDVYSFGALLVALITAKRPAELAVRDEPYSLYNWLRPMRAQRYKLYAVVDWKLRDKYSRDSLCIAVDLALDCLHPNPGIRPSMDRVVLEMKSAVSAARGGGSIQIRMGESSSSSSALTRGEDRQLADEDGTDRRDEDAAARLDKGKGKVTSDG